MSDLTSMINIGAEMAKKLRSVGINSAEQLMETGAKNAFLRLKAAYSNVCLVHLYSLEGAVSGVEFNCLSKEVKENLKEFSDNLKNAE